jgi:glycosyltransferase involved in cell wall biosynthesis
MSGPSEPLVSVVTPVYNGALYLRECIESVLAQTYSNWEYIIINNCSTDDTLQIAEQYAKQDRRIQLYNNEKFLDVIANHNRAFRLISPDSKYCKQVSADDWLFPQCLTRLVAVAEANPSVGIVGSYQLSGNVVKWQGFRYPRAVMTGREVGRRIFLQREIFVEGQPLLGFGDPTSLIYRADIVRQRKDFFPNPSPHADTSACFDILRHWDFGFVYEILSYERIHGESQSAASQQMNLHLPQTLSDLLQYGPSYLDKNELEQHVRETLRKYHRFLTVSYFLGSKGKEFWDYHKGRLREMGYPLTRGALLKAVVIMWLGEIVNPGQAIEKLWKRVFPARIVSHAVTSQSNSAANGLLPSNAKESSVLGASEKVRA